MKTIIVVFTLLTFNFLYPQNDTDMKNSLEKLSQKYLTELYVNKKYDSVSKLWDNRLFIELKSFYSKIKVGDFSDSDLASKIKLDVTKYFNQLSTFQVDEILGSEIEYDNKNIIGEVFYQFTETLKNKSQTIRSMLIYISSDNGKTWMLQDWKIKDIVDKANKGLYE